MSNSQFTMDDIYGVTLDEYCMLHKVTIDDLIDSVELDIELISKNIRQEVYDNDMQNDALLNTLMEARDSKRKHLKRLVEWKRSKNIYLDARYIK